MKTKYKHIYFEEIMSSDEGSLVWNCCNLQGETEVLGTVEHHTP